MYLQTELATIVMETSFTFYKLQWFKICFLDFFVSKKCCDNDVATFAKLLHLTYVRTVTDENIIIMSVVALNLEKGFFAVATYYWH